MALVEVEASVASELAGVANAEHQAVLDSLENAVVHAIKCGEVLLRARDHVPGDEWNQWCRANLRFSLSSAQNYQRLAFHKDRLPVEVFQPFVGEDGARRPASVGRALPYVRGLPYIRGKDSAEREIKRLAGDGLPVKTIAEMVSVSEKTVRCHLNPAVKRRQKELEQERLSRRRHALRLLREQETRKRRDQAAKKAGGAVSLAYSSLRLAIERLDEAIVVEKDPKARFELESGLQNLYKAEDAIGRALRVPPVIHGRTRKAA